MTECSYFLIIRLVVLRPYTRPVLSINLNKPNGSLGITSDPHVLPLGALSWESGTKTSCALYGGVCGGVCGETLLRTD